MKTNRQVTDVNITDSAVLPAPEYLCRDLRRSDELADFVAGARHRIHDIIFGDDRRLLLIVGPCSIHDSEAGLEYARRLKELMPTLQDRLEIVLRVYFEKPRTTVGWKGMIMDPRLDGSYDIPFGLRRARQFLLDVLELGLPTATELLDPITPQYIADLICWSAIGARTTESQTHRQMASGLSMPVGFKNATSGDLTVAVNAIRAAGNPQTFLGISHQGLASALTTRGNPNCHIILRGGQNGTNYDAASVGQAAEILQKAGLIPAVMVDCSHDNSHKNPPQSLEVLRDVASQTLDPKSAVIGAMLESNLVGGSQKFPQPLDQLVRGQSITDPCIGWEETEAILREIHGMLAPRFK